MIRLHEEIPPVSLPDITGGVISTWDYKQERDLVLLFAGDDPAFLQEFAHRHGEYRAANAEIIGIVGKRPTVDLPYPVMVDAEGSTASAYVDRVPFVLVIDAFGVLEGCFDATSALDHDRILALISALEMRCPECGVPEWPPEEH